MKVRACDPTNKEAKMGELLQVQGQPGPFDEFQAGVANRVRTCLKKTKIKSKLMLIKHRDQGTYRRPLPGLAVPEGQSPRWQNEGMVAETGYCTLCACVMC